ncbi:MAG: zinc ABC transporter substrate-binding protein [Trueperaceae bacterium]
MRYPTGYFLFQPLLATVIALLLPWSTGQGEPLAVATTVGMIADVVEEIGAQCTDVTPIMGSGVDPHVYQASARDVRTFGQADVIFYAGYSLEGQLGEVLAGFATRKPTVAVSPSGIDPARLITTQDIYGVDPHVWMDVSMWSGIVPVVASTLSELRPDCAEAIGANTERYQAELAALHEWVSQAVASIPDESRILVTAHDAFAYYGRTYGIEVAGIQGISTESEAGVADIREMARVVAERKVPAVFLETTINSRTIQAVVDAAERLGHRVRIGSLLFSDAMGEEGTAGGTYIGMIYENTVNIVGDLGGTLPALPPALNDWARKWNLVADGRY